MDFVNIIIQNRVIHFLRKWNLINFILGIIDILAIAFACQVAYIINYYYFEGFFFFENKEIAFIFLGILPMWLITLYIIQITEIPRTKRYGTLLIEYLQSAIAVIFILLVFYFVFKL